jgi:hypothetical protein
MILQKMEMSDRKISDLKEKLGVYAGSGSNQLLKDSSVPQPVRQPVTQTKSRSIAA